MDRRSACSYILVSQHVFTANILCIDKLVRGVRLAYPPYSPYAVLAPCRPSRHIEICRAWLVSNTAFLTQSQEISRRRYLFDAAAKS